MMVMAEAIDLITFFVGLELMALSSYLLAGFFRYEERSIEAAMKYFLTGAFASNFILFGHGAALRTYRLHQLPGDRRRHQARSGARSGRW